MRYWHTKPTDKKPQKGINLAIDIGVRISETLFKDNEPMEKSGRLFQLCDDETGEEIMTDTASFVAEFVGYTNNWYVGDAAKSGRLVDGKYRIVEVTE